jgi:transglutaminase-like putative cysteine protease
MSRTFDVTHRTSYAYDESVSVSFGRAYLTPRDVAGQWCVSSRVDVSPEPDQVSPSLDYYGNRSIYLEVHRPHSELVVTARSRVQVSRTAPTPEHLSSWSWEQVRDGVAAGDTRFDGSDLLSARGFLLPSAQVTLGPEVAMYAEGVFRPGRPVGEAVAELAARIHDDFTYRAGVTSVTTTLPEVLVAREGVCQDFAHLAVACLRSVGLPARYVSGYLETRPPPGRPKLAGADASHAWASVLLPDVGWVDAAWGRDYTDVPPLKGVIFTDAKTSTLTVAVDVVPVPDDQELP